MFCRMSNSARKLKYVTYFTKRQMSLDYGYGDGPEDANGTHLKLQRLKSIDEKDSIDLEKANRATTLSGRSVPLNSSLFNRIKLAAIYDDEAEIIRILSSETSMRDG